MVVAIVGGPSLPPAAGAQAAGGSPQDGGDNAVMLVVDTSGSMGESDGSPNGTRKIEGAKSALLNFIGGLPTTATVGLRTYPGKTSGCSVGELAFAPTLRDTTEMHPRIRTLTPDGDTPTAEALEQAADDLRGGGYTHGTVILVSDGLSTCGDPCAAAASIAESGIDLSVITIGFQISTEGKKELECIADATGGEYVDADDGERLDEVLGRLNRPQLTLRLSHMKTVVADVGIGQGTVTIDAEISNTGEVEARAVTAQLRYDDIETSPGTRRPYRIVGNLPVGSRDATVRWTFQASPLLVGKEVRFSVIVRATDLEQDLVSKGVVKVVDASGRDDSGDILRRPKRIAILGDSYSSGEGAFEYLDGTATKENKCHRSSRTYLVGEFQIAPEDILACSGAVAEQVKAATQDGTSGPQVQQLRERLIVDGTTLDAVALTIGGNDLGFDSIAKGCLIGFNTPCNEEVGGKGADQFLEEGMSGLSGQLHSTYEAVNDVLNSEEMVAERGGFAPIIVLGYPRIIPSAHRSSCLTMAVHPLGVNTPTVTLVSQDELDFIDRVITRLNGVIEGTVRASANGYRGGRDKLPVAFVDTTEDSFLPDHTVCDLVRYANGLEDARFYGDLANAAFATGAAVATRRPIDAVRAFFAVKKGVDEFTQKVQELMHPNVDGYDALSRAVIRWSLSDDAKRLRSQLDRKDAFALGDGQVARSVRSSTQLQPGDSFTVVPGHVHPLTARGLLPGTSAWITIESTPIALASVYADEEGRIETSIRIPDGVESGSHHVVVLGTAEDGDVAIRRIAVEVRGGPPWAPLASILVPVLLVLVGWWLRRRPDRNGRVGKLQPT